MCGAWNGLQALISKECPQAYYVHYFAHRLQLALVGAFNGVQDVCLFFSKLFFIVNFVSASPKRKSELQAIHKLEIEKMIASGELDTSKGGNQMITLQRGLNINGSTNAIRGEARGLDTHMRSFEFVFLLHLMHKTMRITNVLCKALQDKSQDIVNAMGLVSSRKTLLQKMRTEGWEMFFADVCSFCTKHGVIVPEMSAPYTIGSGRSCSERDCITLEHHYHFDIFIRVIEYQVMELKNRFNEEAIELLTLSSALDPHDGFISFRIDDIYRIAEKVYPQDFSGNDVDILRSEKSKFFNLIYKLIRLVLTLLVSMTTTKRAFSATTILKTDLRNKMEDEFLGDIMVIYIERQLAKNIDIDSMTDDFDDMTDHRVKLR
ncbi:hypothetical protein AQUCO_00600265v1 [Aquilegia coerulea]|uniref:HAT C-terminal dimerisation domain-containing protein n=1 Tax=Aquilegia coerulea TaxID=218851 RepID=A0A2G5ENR0_AQUCA|nr:hypothetical protein AQUCO_00600265v1 [Aquilegia coerulea]